MYNEVVKNEYLQETSSSIEYILRNLFNKLETIEDVKGKDICNFVENEIIEALTGLNSSSANTLAGYTSMLRSYTQWCCQNNINRDHINHFDNISISMVEECVNHIINKEKFITLEELNKVMENIINPCDKALVLSLFYGICGKEAVEVTNLTYDMLRRTEDNGYKAKLITGREVNISNDLFNLISISCNTYDYILTSGKKFDSLKLDESSPCMFKPRANARFNTQEKKKLRLTARLLKLREETDCVGLTIDRLKSSGMLYFMKQIIAEKGIDPMDVFNTDEFYELKKQYDVRHQQTFQLKAKYKAYL